MILSKLILFVQHKGFEQSCDLYSHTILHYNFSRLKKKINRKNRPQRTTEKKFPWFWKEQFQVCFAWNILVLLCLFLAQPSLLLSVSSKFILEVSGWFMFLANDQSSVHKQWPCMWQAELFQGKDGKGHILFLSRSMSLSSEEFYTCVSQLAKEVLRSQFGQTVVL